MDQISTDALTQRSRSATFARSLVIALTAFFTLVDLFATQAILPSLTKHYGVSPAAMGLAVNSSTFGMAAAGLAMAFHSHRFERRFGILISLCLLSIPTTLLAFAPNLGVFAALRVTQGLFMATAFQPNSCLPRRALPRYGHRRSLRRLHHRQCRQQPRRSLYRRRGRQRRRPCRELLCVCSP